MLSTQSSANESSVICWQSLFQNVYVSDDCPHLPGRLSCCPLIPNECLSLCHATPAESKCAPWVIRNHVGVSVIATCVLVSVAMSAISLSRLSVRKSFTAQAPDGTQTIHLGRMPMTLRIKCRSTMRAFTSWLFQTGRLLPGCGHLPKLITNGAGTVDEFTGRSIQWRAQLTLTQLTLPYICN